MTKRTRWRCAGEHLPAPHAAPRLRSGRPELVEGRKLAFRLGTLPPARRLGTDSRRRRSGAIGPAVVIRAPACTWTEVAAEHSLQASFGFAVMRRAPQVGAPRHISTATRNGTRVQFDAQRRALTSLFTGGRSPHSAGETGGTLGGNRATTEGHSGARSPERLAKRDLRSRDGEGGKTAL